MMLRTSLGLLGALTLTASPVMAQERKVEVTPYLGVDQTVLVPLKGGGDVLTYTNVTAGLTAQLQTRRVEAVADVQYNHSFGWGREASDQDVISGIVSGQYLVSHGLTLNAGAIDLCVPPEAGLRIRANDQLTFATNLGDRGLTRTGGVWSRPGWR